MTVLQLAELAAAHDLARAQPLRMEAHHEGFHHDAVLRALAQLLGLRGVDRDRLLAQHVLAGLGGLRWSAARAGGWAAGCRPRRHWGRPAAPHRCHRPWGCRASRRPAWARLRSREAMATTSEWGERWMPGMTFLMPILAVLMMPQRSLRVAICPLPNAAGGPERPPASIPATMPQVERGLPSPGGRRKTGKTAQSRACSRGPPSLLSGRFPRPRPFVRRGARVVDRGGLENRCTCKGTVGSNPTLSAIYAFQQHPIVPSGVSEILRHRNFPRFFRLEPSHTISLQVTGRLMGRKSVAEDASTHQSARCLKDWRATGPASMPMGPDFICKSVVAARAHGPTDSRSMVGSATWVLAQPSRSTSLKRASRFFIAARLQRFAVAACARDHHVPVVLCGKTRAPRAVTVWPPALPTEAWRAASGEWIGDH